MGMRSLRAWAAALAMLAAAGACAQSPYCGQIAAELAAGTGGGGDAMRQAATLRRQYAQIQSALLRYGCDQPGGLFGPQPPLECAGLRQQGQALAMQSRQAEAAARQDGDGRRAQLAAAYAAHGCAGRSEAAVARPGPARDDAPRYATATIPAPAEGRAETQPGETAPPLSRLPVCVRTCDGFFFPVNYQGAEGRYGDICRASCPGASAELYWMREGGDIAEAVGARGGSYAALPNALAFRKARTPACSCKAEEQSWGGVLQGAEALIARKSDILVTSESSARMARPAPPELRGLSLRGEGAEEAGGRPAASPGFDSPARTIAPTRSASR